MNYEIIVVGGGHAGCEASLASARKGHKTLLITGNIKNIADMPCNPSIGGSAKGIVVREIDALGGEMGRNADKTLQFCAVTSRCACPSYTDPSNTSELFQQAQSAERNQSYPVLSAIRQSFPR